MINSILKNALLNYKLYTTEREEELHNRLKMVIFHFIILKSI
jgi:hypothetical protein